MADEDTVEHEYAECSERAAQDYCGGPLIMAPPPDAPLSLEQQCAEWERLEREVGDGKPLGSMSHPEEPAVDESAEISEDAIATMPEPPVLARLREDIETWANAWELPVSDAAKEDLIKACWSNFLAGSPPLLIKSRLHEEDLPGLLLSPQPGEWIDLYAFPWRPSVLGDTSSEWAEQQRKALALIGFSPEESTATSPDPTAITRDIARGG